MRANKEMNLHMPNWCQGQMKIRGEFNSLVKFIKEVFKTSECCGIQQEELYIHEETDTSFWFEVKKLLYIEGTRRNFVETCDTFFNKENKKTVLVVPYRAAWEIDVVPLISLSEKYSVDFKIYAFEKGMEFCQDIEIVDGNLLKDEKILFNDWNWDCFCPLTGG